MDFELFPKNNTIIIDTIPKDARGQQSINLGLEILKQYTSAKVISWWEKLDLDYNLLYFNIFYPTHIFNMLAFLRNNNISFFKKDRKIKIVVGGQGVANLNNLLENIVDYVFKGELEGYFDNNIDKFGFYRAKEINSVPIIKNGHTLIELNRGCKYFCSFCEYGNVCGGKYREKNWDLLKDQIDSITSSVKSINFLSPNLGAYSHIEKLLEYCISKNIKVNNSDITIKDLPRIHPYFKPLRITTVKFGIESFCEKTRFSIRKRITDDDIIKSINLILEGCSYLHFYLIYGLPNDDYEKWYSWLKYLGDLRKSITHKNLRFEFSITNFEPCKGTPYENAPLVDFRKKEEFLKKWIEALKQNSFLKRDKEVTYATGRGRLGRKENSYLLLMTLKNSGSEIESALLSSFPRGVGRSIDDKLALDFLNKIRLEPFLF